MTRYAATVGHQRYAFADLKQVMARASPLRSGDQLACGSPIPRPPWNH